MNFKTAMRVMAALTLALFTVGSARAFSKDVYAFEIVNSVPSISPKCIRTTVNGVTTVVEFSPAGRLVSASGATLGDGLTVERNAQGYLTSITVVVDGTKVTTNFGEYGSGDVPVMMKALLNGQVYSTMNVAKCERGRMIEVNGMMEGYPYKVKYKDYKFDNHGNWIYRTWKNPAGQKIEERRDIIYDYHEDLTNLGDWAALVCGKRFWVMFKCDDGKNVERLSSPYPYFFFEKSGLIGGVYFPSDGTYCEVRDRKLCIMLDGKVIETLTLISLDNAGYIQVKNSQGQLLYFKQ